MQTFDWAAEDIVAAHPGLYLEHCAVMAAAVMSRQSVPPCEFLVQCDWFRRPISGGQDRFLLRVSWSEATEWKAQRWRGQTRSTGRSRRGRGDGQLVNDPNHTRHVTEAFQAHALILA